jgi:hypothetical protein
VGHAVIIIRRSSSSSAHDAIESSYEYTIPVPHDATPQQVGEMTRKAYKRLENSDD